MNIKSNKTNESPYGIGLGVKLLDTYQEFVELKELRTKHAKLIVDPPGGFLGDPKLFMKIRLQAGARNYLGDGITENADYKQLYTSGNLLDITQDLQDCRAKIKEVCMSNPMGDVSQTRERVTKSEIQERMSLFRERFANMQENFQEELLQPAFTIPMTILMQKSIITFTALAEQNEGGAKAGDVSGQLKDIMDMTNFSYMNAMSKMGDKEEVDAVVSYIGIIAQTRPEKMQYAVKDEKFIEYVGNKLAIPKSIRFSPEEVGAQAEAEEKAREQAMSEEAMMGQATNEMAMQEGQMNLEAKAQELEAGKAPAQEPQGGEIIE